MSEDDRNATPPAIYVGLAFCMAAVAWWFAYYAQYGGAFGLLGLKVACIGFATPECSFFQALLPSQPLTRLHREYVVTIR